MKSEYVMVEKPEINMSKKEQEAFDKLVLNALYQSLFASGKLTIEQVKYLENINDNYWL